MSDGDYSDLEDELPTATPAEQSPQRKRQKLDSNPNTPDSSGKPDITTNDDIDAALHASQPTADDDSIVVQAQRIPIVIDLTAVQQECRAKQQAAVNSKAKPVTSTHTLPDTTVHLLPCMIDYNGSANVQTYFIPTITPVANTYNPDSDINHQSAPTHYKSTFRGRGLTGECMQLKGQVIVLQENVKDSDWTIANTAADSGAAADGHRMTFTADGKLHWAAVEATDRLWMWCRDEERHERDALKRALTEWPALAGALHQPIPTS